MTEFDFIMTPNKLIIICYFQENLKPSIRVEIKQQNQKAASYTEIVQRAVNAEAKTGLRSNFII